MIAIKTRAPRSPQPHVSHVGLVERRMACGLSQARLAQLCGINPNTMSRVERGVWPLTEGVAKRIDSVLGAFERSLAEVTAQYEN